MRTQHGGAHPSERLVRGPAGFWEALEMVDAQFAFERAVALRGLEDRAALAEMAAEHAQISAATRAARRVWQEEQEAARRRTVERLRSDALAAEAALDDEAARWLGRPRHGFGGWGRRWVSDRQEDGEGMRRWS